MTTDSQALWTFGAIGFAFAALFAAVALLVAEVRHSRRLLQEVERLRGENRLAQDRLLLALTAGPAQVAGTVSYEQTDDPPRVMTDEREAELERLARRDAPGEDG